MLHVTWFKLFHSKNCLMTSQYEVLQNSGWKMGFGSSCPSQKVDSSSFHRTFEKLLNFSMRELFLYFSVSSPVKMGRRYISCSYLSGYFFMLKYKVSGRISGTYHSGNINVNLITERLSKPGVSKL